ncbi:MAG: tRNA lysidine(34) synthetase TilS [Bacteroidales bacterium]|nr:tRNA lysidine(34) synthetase TilS [Bacteroidales bacterium]
MQRSIKAYIEQHQLFSERDRLLVAFSGGPDSVALLTVLHGLGYDCRPVHVNFHLRGAESDRDEAFARDYCSGLGLDCRVEHLYAADYAARQGVSVEMAARSLRYRRFEEIRQAERLDYIVTGHHQDDNIETFFLNLLRGSGPMGLAGIRPKNGRVVRPLLAVSRPQIMAWLAGHNLPYVTDSSNGQTDFRRNRIRLNLLPEIDKTSPAARECMARSIGLQRECADYYAQEIGRAMTRLGLTGPGGETIQKDHDAARGGFTGLLARLPVSLLEQESLPQGILYTWLSAYGFDTRTVEAIWRGRHDASGKQYESPGFRLLLDRGVWLLDSRDSVPGDMQEMFVREDDTRVAFLELERLPMPAVIEADARTACLDAGKLKFPLCLRPLRHGDSFVPLGMTGHRLVSDYLTDCKRTRWEKQQTWVLLSGEEIVWVVGERISHPYRVTGQTRTMLRITCRQADNSNTE